MLKSFDSRESWLEARRQFIGSSDSRAILGFGYAAESISTVWAAKVGGDRPVLPSQLSALLDQGSRAESFVISEFCHRHPEFEVIRDGDFCFHVSPKYPYLAASLDARIRNFDGEHDAPVEAKYVSGRNYKEWTDDQVPSKYWVQVQHQMLVTGTSQAVVVAIVGGDYHERWVDRDQEYIESQMLPAYRYFWSCVASRTAPPTDESIVGTRAVLSVTSQPGKALCAGSAVASLCDAYELARQSLARSQVEHDRLLSEIVRCSKGCEFVCLPDGRVLKIGKKSLKLQSKLPASAQLVD